MSPTKQEKTILDALIEEKLIRPDQLNELKKEAQAGQVDIEDIIIEKKLVSEDVIFEKKSRLLNLPIKTFSEGNLIPRGVLEEIPEEAARFYKFVPLQKENKILDVGMVKPEDIRAQEALRFITLRSSFKPKIYLIKPTDFNKAIKHYRTLHGEVSEALEELSVELAEEKKPREKKIGEEEKIFAEAPITKIVAVILKHGVEGNASDIHIEPTENQLRVRFRVDGILHTSLILPKDLLPSLISRIKILTNMRIDETRVPQDGRFRAKIDNKSIDFRVATFPTAVGEKVALRLLDPTSGIANPSDLGLQGRNLKVIEEGLKEPYGMIIISGPTGSGKSTTLFALLNILNKEGVNIVSLEDPVEYYIEGVNQSLIRPEIGYNFSTGLRHILRQDPDIIMVGEIRDHETAGLAIHAALTGHILLSSLHTNNSVTIIPRLIDLKVDAFLLPSSLNLMIAQRLVRKLCQDCKKEVAPTAQQKKLIEETVSLLTAEEKEKLNIKPPYKIYEPEYCKTCIKGTKGRIGIFEIFQMTPQLEEIIISPDLSESKIAAEAKRQGMITLLQDGVIKSLQGLVSLEEVINVAGLD